MIENKFISKDEFIALAKKYEYSDEAIGDLLTLHEEMEHDLGMKIDDYSLPASTLHHDIYD